ncbi:hypothetical protein LTR74_011276 [Friedmanniomyces endolithicus]|nr:hypothetical protein LTR74_011276 [Friedmanniomyces endolithicus]
MTDWKKLEDAFPPAYHFHVADLKHNALNTLDLEHNALNMADLPQHADAIELGNLPPNAVPQQQPQARPDLEERERIVTYREAQIANKEALYRQFQLTVESHGHWSRWSAMVLGTLAYIASWVVILVWREDLRVQCTRAHGLAAWSVKVGCQMIALHQVCSFIFDGMAYTTDHNSNTRRFCIVVLNHLSIIMLGIALMESLWASASVKKPNQSRDIHANLDLNDRRPLSASTGTAQPHLRIGALWQRLFPARNKHRFQHLRTAQSLANPTSHSNQPRYPRRDIADVAPRFKSWLEVYESHLHYLKLFVLAPCLLHDTTCIWSISGPRDKISDVALVFESIRPPRTLRPVRDGEEQACMDEWTRWLKPIPDWIGESEVTAEMCLEIVEHAEMWAGAWGGCKEARQYKRDAARAAARDARKARKATWNGEEVKTENWDESEVESEDESADESDDRQ